MTLDELVQAVYTETNRPDLVPETLQAVLEATLSVHTFELFPKDICESQVIFDDPTLYLQQLDMSSVPFFRRIAYLRKGNPVQTQVEQQNGILPSIYIFPPQQFNFLKRVDIDDVINEYGREKTDVWYAAGSEINIKSSTQLQYLRIGWYRFPNIDSSGVLFDSWIAKDYPYCIVYKAAGSIFSKIGETASQAIYMRQPVPGQGDDTGGEFFKQRAILISNNIRMGD